MGSPLCGEAHVPILFAGSLGGFYPPEVFVPVVGGFAPLRLR